MLTEVFDGVSPQFWTKVLTFDVCDGSILQLLPALVPTSSSTENAAEFRLQ